jgi:hypothetical protein
MDATTVMTDEDLRRELEEYRQFMLRHCWPAGTFRRMPWWKRLLRAVGILDATRPTKYLGR